MAVDVSATASLFGGAILLGVVHGAEPGHGWPVAATYALNRPRTWLHALAASTLLGLGHLVSSIAVVVVFFLAKDFFNLTQLGWVRYVAGALLIALGIREYRHGHSHSHDFAGDDDDAHTHDHGHDDDAGHGHDHSHDAEHGHDHSHDDEHGHDHSHDAEHGHDHSHDDEHGHDHGGRHSHDHSDHDYIHEIDTGQGHDSPNGSQGWRERLRSAIPFVGGGHGHDHAHLSQENVDATGLWSIVGTAFVLGFAHEEEFEIIGLCLGSSYCLELMFVYALAVLVALVALTMGLVAGISRYEERLTPYLGYLPTISAAVLILLGLGFIAGVV